MNTFKKIVAITLGLIAVMCAAAGAVTLIALVQPAHAQASSTWEKIGSNSGGNYYEINVPSFRVADGNRSIVFRSVERNGSTWFARYVISDAVCDAGVGSAQVIDIRTSQAMPQAYVRDGGTIASAIGDVLCGVTATRPQAPSSNNPGERRL